MMMGFFTTSRGSYCFALRGRLYRLLELECGHRITRKIIEAGLQQKARYAKMG
jgi:hypothetical protein